MPQTKRPPQGEFALLDPTSGGKLPSYFKTNKELWADVSKKETEYPGYESWFKEEHPGQFSAGAGAGGDFVSRPGYESDYWKKYGEWAGGLETEFGAADEATIRKDMADRMQTQIDAVNAMYAGLIAREEEAGVGRLGRTRAMGARGGLLGSPMGEAQMEETRKGTAEQVKYIKEEQQVRIEAIFGKIDERAEEEIRFKKAEALAGTEARLTYMKEHAEAIREDWGGLASSGIALERIKSNEEYYGQAMDELGMDELQFDFWYESKMPADKQLDYSEIQYEKDGNIWLKRIGFDPATGEKKEYNYDLSLPWPGVAAQYKHTQLDDGTVIFIPETLDPDKTLEEQVIMYGAKGEFAKPDEEEDKAAAYKSGMLADKTAGMPYDDAVTTYGSVVDLDYIDRIYGEGTYKGVDIETKFYEDIEEWDKKVKDSPDKYYKKTEGGVVKYYESISWWPDEEVFSYQTK